MPTKAELQQLQKHFKTDEKIGERLGVPGYLVAYWRRKKGVPKYSLPKFSEQEIKNLWERYGDDEKAGLELGISKAAFYNWRRRYGFKEKPAFLKLEQLEFSFPGARGATTGTSLYGKRSTAQKIIARCAGVDNVEVGDEVEVEPDLVALHTTAPKVVDRFKNKDTDFVWNPNKIVMTLGYGNPNGRDPAADHRMLREFARRQGIKSFYDLNEGHSAQVVIERGHILPGLLVLGGEHDIPAYGCLSSLAMSVDPDNLPDICAGGKHTLTVPKTTRIMISGRRFKGIYAKDIILSVIEKLEIDAIRDHAIEFGGSVVSQMSISERTVLTSMARDMGARTAICPYDATVRRYLTNRTDIKAQPVLPDKDAEYANIYQVNIDQVVPQVARAASALEVKAAAELENLPVNQVIVGSCVSGRFDELRAAADVLKGKQVHPECRMLIIPGSRRVYLEALKKGLIRVFIEAGAIVMNPSTCPCRGMPIGQLADGERCVATSTAHLASDLGSSKADTYICSPATAAATALNAALTDPMRYLK